MKHIEDSHQVRIINWSKTKLLVYPDKLQSAPLFEFLYAIPNGGKRNAKEAARLKRQGVKAGVSDLNLPIPSGPYAGLWVELKAPIVKGKSKPVVSSAQKAWGLKMQSFGHKFVVCYGADQAIEEIEEYLGSQLLNLYRGLKQ